jgi:protein unc-80
LITANVPSAKKLIVHGPDLSQIPNQFPIYDDTQFIFIIQESFEFFSIPELKKDKCFLFDVKTSK